ncbi:TlpA family protein disulfide reductase [Cognatilysobacter bugurensis]|uniref:Alkyl hydroperoxide reductase subunit C/ Thiol specific antioxidant domain-containing protein n=1 Tax=Cognatilysobacter bugurensis TaxID=543356 RepID=A0A918SW28_9GAMM|nr:TlpA disulfide reductase family protein [Lysobacter bugurensis]GHA72865.1 hypothetical protein GCM10007067_06840 [Lysobacter bugurensis]
MLALGLGTLTAHAAPAVGDTPPDRLGRTPQGDEARISDWRGKLLVVAFGWSWNGRRRNQLPLLEAIQKAAGCDQLEVVPLNFKGPARTHREITRTLKGATLMLTHNRDRAISAAYHVTSVPQMFMIDKAGRIGWAHYG